MAIPEQIRKQTEAVQQLYQQLNPDDNTGGTTSADGTVTSVEDRNNTPLADANSALNNAAPSSANEHKPDDDNLPEETIVQKYKTLQGMYNAEVPRLHQQNREMVNRVQQMEQLLASLSTQQTSTQQQQQIVEKIVTDKDVEEYGESLDVMRKVSREELIPMEQRFAQMEQMLRQMQTNVVPQVQAVAQRQQVSAEQEFWAELTSAVPNFRQINDNSAFQSWLLAADPLTGITRQTYLDDAQRSLDARRVANFFRAWLESTGQAAVAQSTGRAQNSELEKQVTPGRSRNTGAPATTNQGKMYSPQDIQKFFNDVRSGKYKGREPERDRIERDIFAAQRENRIQANA
jgi:F0F1-type ATP synthase delta subunit